MQKKYFYAIKICVYGPIMVTIRRKNVPLRLKLYKYKVYGKDIIKDTKRFAEFHSCYIVYRNSGIGHHRWLFCVLMV